MKKKSSKKYSDKNIEKKIRAEQRVSNSLGKTNSYKKTSSYKNLSKKQKQSFDNHLKSKEITIKLPLIILMLSLTSLIFLRIEYTGRIIKDTIEPSTFNIIYSIGLFVLLGLIIFTIFKIIKKSK